jgi:enoyl-CoA hydratase
MLTRACVRAFSSATSSKLVLVKHDAATRVVTLTLNAPDKLNALTEPMGDEFSAILKEQNWSEVGALVLTGSGRAFSAGGDLDFLRRRCADKPENNTKIMRKFYGYFGEALSKVPVPTIAAINGHAVGAGLALAMAADFRFAAAKAKLSVSFVGLGLHPGMGSTFTLPNLLGYQQGAKMLLTGDPISGEEAARMGLVLEACDEAEVLPRATKLAERIAEQAPQAVRLCLQTIRAAHFGGLDAALQREAEAQAVSYGSSDLREGIEAVAAKRKPTWKDWKL